MATIDDFMALDMTPNSKVLAWAALRAGPGDHDALALGRQVGMSTGEAAHAAVMLSTPNPVQMFFPRAAPNRVKVPEGHPWLALFAPPAPVVVEEKSKKARGAA